MDHGHQTLTDEDLLLFKKIKDDPVEFAKYVITKDEADKDNPFKLFPIEDLEYIQLYYAVLQRETRVAVPKSRRMKMTWATVIYILWDTMFHGGRHNAVVSKKEDDADWIVKNRFKVLYDNLDKRIKRLPIPKARYIYNHLFFDEIDSLLQGFPSGEDQLRMYTLSNIFADEIAFWEKAAGTYKGAIPCTEGGGTFICISSAGPGWFKRLVHDELDQEGKEEISDPEITFPMEGVRMWRNIVNEFLIFEIHYTADPLKRTAKWKAETRKGISTPDWNQEYEIQWDTYTGTPVYRDFDAPIHIEEGELYPHYGLPILRGWDFGLTPALVLAQLQERKLVVFKEYTALNMGVDRFCDLVLPQFAVDFPGFTKPNQDFIDIIDASGFFRDDAKEETSAQVLRENGLKPIPGEVSWEKRRKSVEKYLVTLDRGSPCFVVSKAGCPVLTSGFNGGYRYAENALELEVGKQRPLKDIHSHPHDGLQMITSKLKSILRKHIGKIPRPNYLNKRGA